MIKKFLNITLLLVVLVLPSMTVVVNAQSQNDINPKFDASSSNPLYINLNYDCTNVEWPDGAISTYRRIYYPGSTGYSDNINIPTAFKTENFPFAETYYLYDDGITPLEMEASLLSGYKSSYFSNQDRVVRQPFIIPNTKEYDIIKNDPILEGLVGRPLCVAEKFSHNDRLYMRIADAQDVQITKNVLERLNTLSLGNNNFIDANLVPPALQQLENYTLEAIYLFWGFLGVASTIMLMIIGVRYLTLGYSPEKKGDVYSKLAFWVLGEVLAILAIPLLQFIYEIIDINSTKCFKYTDENNIERLSYDLTAPGFTFFFPNVCTGDYAVKEQSN